MLAVYHAYRSLLLLQLACSRLMCVKSTFLRVQLLDTGSLTGGMTSWDTPAMPSQPALAPRPPASTPRPNPQPASQSSWQNSKPIAAVRDAPAPAGPSDPFAGLPPPQAAKPSNAGGDNDLLSVSLFDGLSSGKAPPLTPPTCRFWHLSLRLLSIASTGDCDGLSYHVVCMSICSLCLLSDGVCLTAGPASTSYQRPKLQAPHPGDQLANVMSNDRSDALFMDPSWADPDLGGPGRGMGMGQGGPPRLAQPNSTTMHSSAAADPFSQLSLSRGSSGECNNGCLLIKMTLLL